MVVFRLEVYLDLAVLKGKKLSVSIVLMNNLNQQLFLLFFFPLFTL